MEIKSWYFALFGFLFSYICLPSVFDKYLNTSTFTVMGMSFGYFVLTIIFVTPVILLWANEDTKISTVVLLWLLAAFGACCIFEGSIILFMAPAYFIIPSLIVCVMLLNYGRQEKGAVLSILIGIFVAYLTVDHSGVNFSNSILPLLTVFFYLSAGVVFFREENITRSYKG